MVPTAALPTTDSDCQYVELQLEEFQQHVFVFTVPTEKAYRVHAVGLVSLPV